jgi:hypothetical protein
MKARRYVQYSTVQCLRASLTYDYTVTQRTQASTGTLSDDIPPARQPYGIVSVDRESPAAAVPSRASVPKLKSSGRKDSASPSYM